MIYLKQLKIFSYYRKFLRFLADLLCENLSLASVFKAIIITQLVLKITTYRKKQTKKQKKQQQHYCSPTQLSHHKIYQKVFCVFSN